MNTVRFRSMIDGIATETLKINLNGENTMSNQFSKMLDNGSELSKMFVKPERTDTDRIEFFENNPNRIGTKFGFWTVSDMETQILFNTFRQAVDFAMDTEI